MIHPECLERRSTSAPFLLWAICLAACSSSPTPPDTLAATSSETCFTHTYEPSRARLEFDLAPLVPRVQAHYGDGTLVCARPASRHGDPRCADLMAFEAESEAEDQAPPFWGFYVYEIEDMSMKAILYVASDPQLHVADSCASTHDTVATLDWCDGVRTASIARQVRHYANTESEKRTVFTPIESQVSLSTTDPHTCYALLTSHTKSHLHESAYISNHALVIQVFRRGSRVTAAFEAGTSLPSLDQKSEYAALLRDIAEHLNEAYP